MPDLKTCPACGTEMDEHLDQCPECGLKGLKRAFLSRDEHQDWIRNVLEPHKQWYATHSEKALKTPCRVFAGQNHALFLTKGGRLYGFGSNDTDSIAPGEDREVRTPLLMAENIASAAAGHSYSICLDRDGGVRLFGQTSYPYPERFRMPGGRAAEVFASPSDNIFWLRMEDGRLLSFGYNMRKQIAPWIEKVYFTFPEISLKIHYSGDFVTNYTSYGSCGPQPYASHGYYYYSNRGSLLTDQLLCFKNTPQYYQAAREFGDCNLDVRFRPLPEKTHILSKDEKVNRIRNGDYARDDTHVKLVQREYFVPELYLLNYHIFTPVPVPEGKFHDPSRFLCGSGLVDSKRVFSGEAEKNDGPDRLMDTDQKVCFASESVSCILTRDHFLDLEDKDVVKDSVTHEPYGRKRVLDGVLDCSAADRRVYLLREDGRIFQTTTDDLWELAFWDDFREVPLP